MKGGFCILLILFCCISSVSALGAFQYYQEISYTACDQEIYQQDVIINRTTGDAYEETSNGMNIWHLYVSDHCQNDYGDVRFMTGDTVLSYYLSTYTETTGTFCVNMTTAMSGDKIRIYYGSDDETTSDRDATFPLWLDFDDGDLSDWTRLTQYSTPPFITVDETGRGKVFKSGPRSLCAGCYYYDLEYTGNGTLNFDVYCPKYTSGNGQEGMEAIAVATYSGDTLLKTHVAAFTNKVQDSSNAGNLYEAFNTFKYAPNSVHTFSLLNSLGTSGWVSSSINFADDNITKVRILVKHEDGTGAGSYAYWDDFCLRQYSETPPIASAFSGEVGREDLSRFPGYDTPTDQDGDGLYEDINGNRRLDFQDIMIFFQYNSWAQANQPNVSRFDWSGNGVIEFSDVQLFWEKEFT